MLSNETSITLTGVHSSKGAVGREASSDTPYGKHRTGEQDCPGLIRWRSEISMAVLISPNVALHVLVQQGNEFRVEARMLQHSHHIRHPSGQDFALSQKHTAGHSTAERERDGG